MPRALAALLLSLAACATGAARGDEGAARVARAWADAVAGDDPRAAYELLAAPVRHRKTFEAFEREWRESAAERARQAQAVAAALKGGARLGERGALALADGQVATLTRDAGGWALDRPLVAAVRPASAEDALRRLADALDERSFPAVLRLLSSERQEAARSLLDAFASGLRAHAADLVEVSEDRATLVWTDGSHRWRVVLKREQGAWRIDDFAPQ